MANLAWLGFGALLAVVGLAIYFGLAPQGGSSGLNPLQAVGAGAVLVGIVVAAIGIWPEHGNSGR